MAVAPRPDNRIERGTATCEMNVRNDRLGRDRRNDVTLALMDFQEPEAHERRKRLAIDRYEWCVKRVELQEDRTTVLEDLAQTVRSR